MNYKINLSEEELFILIASLNVAICNSRARAKGEVIDYLKKGYEREVEDFQDTLNMVLRKAEKVKEDEGKFVLIRQDSLNDVQEIFIFDTEEEAVAKMEDEFRTTLDWLLKHGVEMGEDGFIQEDGEWYRNLISRSKPDDYTYLWNIHISD